MKMPFAIPIYLVGLWIFCQSFCGTYYLLELLQTVVWWIYTCQIDLQKWLNMMISYWVSGCGMLNLHQLWSYSSCLLVWEVYHLLLTHCVLVFLVPCWVLWDPGTGILCHWVWVQWQNFHHSAISSTASGSSVWFLKSFHLFLNGSCNAYAIHLGRTWYGFTSSLTCKEKVPLKHPIPVNIWLYSLCIFSVVSVLATLVSSCACTCNKVTYFLF